MRYFEINSSHSYLPKVQTDRYHTIGMDFDPVMKKIKNRFNENVGYLLTINVTLILQVHGICESVVVAAGSPPRAVVSPARDQLDSSLSPLQRQVRVWLADLPDTVVEAVLAATLLALEAQLLEDKDKKLIMSLINIEQMRYNDFFFGVHSLLSILKGFNLSRIEFTNR